MQFYIKNVILYSKNHNNPPRVVSFKENKINVITGVSQRGKSAIIDIIDYCLGSSDCDIPIGKIRDNVEVFALYVKYKNEHLFIGRENFEKSQSDMYFFKENIEHERKELRSNRWLDNKDEYRTNTQYMKKVLSDMAGFKNISSAENQNKNKFDTPASFRDTSAFQFQTQNIIANPSTMFYKTDSWEHLAKLRTIFPLVLGYKSYEILEIEKEKNDLETEKNRLAKRLEDIKIQYNNWHSDVYEFYSEAINLGLTISNIDISNSSVEILQNELSRIVENSKKGQLYKKGASNIFSEKSKELIFSRNNLIREVSKLKTDSYKINQLINSKKEYINNVALEKENRLKPVDWFLEQKGNNTCPFCNSESTKAIDELLSLKNVKDENRNILDDSHSLTLSFEKQKQELDTEIAFKESKLIQIDKNIAILQSEIKEHEKSFQNTYKYIGKISHALDNLDKISPSGELETEIAKIQSKINTIKSSLDKLYVKFDKDFSLNKLSKTIGHYIKELPIEDKEVKKVHLDPEKSINIKIEDTKTNNQHFLSRLGSGANYMGYHLATMLGLHNFFFDFKKLEKHNFIPTFLILDQPSQVYYPDQDRVNGSKEDSKDYIDTRKIFETCVSFMRRTEQNVQLIILEHVSKSTWSNIDDDLFHISGEWRDDNNINENALIPQDWL